MQRGQDLKHPCAFDSMHFGVMTWQPHCSGDALPPPLKGVDESEHTQMELV